ncbi:YrdB family protein [Microbacterium sp. EST19A]|uniref:YrdB family protein n=1 Tax=Microbacterium sp. EST19A TaxID=2862681 RepID=UPI001CBAD787|nr:YrdB family protein [Microbacterium sp. EST19A]
MPQDSAPVPGVVRPVITVLDVVRAIVLVVVVASLALWGFASWSLPWNVIAGLGAPIVVLLIWALFLSPRPVLRVHPFLRAAVELFIYVGVTIAWWSMGQALIGTAFALVAIVTGVLTGRRALS